MIIKSLDVLYGSFSISFIVWLYLHINFYVYPVLHPYSIDPLFCGRNTNAPYLKIGDTYVIHE